jgi:hypothetical protein
MPFGGVKASGIGRENARAAIEAYSQPKAVYVGADPGGGTVLMIHRISMGYPGSPHVDNAESAPCAIARAPTQGGCEQTTGAGA